MELRPIIVIAGPTATGKSDLALKLATSINGVIVNSDSRQVYKELTIGTARPLEDSFLNISHYLYGYVSVKDPFNLFKYQSDVFKLLETISKEKPIILVGGTGLYIDSVIFNYKLQEQNTNLNLRKKLSKLPTEALQAQVQKDILDKLSNSEKNNPRRLIRIIEKGINAYEKGNAFPHRYFVIDLPNEILKARVEQRVQTMFESGLEAECKSLYTNGYYEYSALNTIGYKEFVEYFKGNKTLDTVKQEIIQNTMKYVKRQRTWFRRNQNAIWATDFDLILKESQNLLENS